MSATCTLPHARRDRSVDAKARERLKRLATLFVIGRAGERGDPPRARLLERLWTTPEEKLITTEEYSTFSFHPFVCMRGDFVSCIDLDTKMSQKTIALAA